MRPLCLRSPLAVVIAAVVATGVVACAAPPVPAPRSPAPGDAAAPAGAAGAPAGAASASRAPAGGEPTAAAAQPTAAAAQLAAGAPGPGAPTATQLAPGAPGQAALIATDGLEPGSPIAGVVIGADGRPAAGAYVEISGDRPGHTCCVQYTVIADAGGRFRFGVEPAGARLGLWARSRDFAQAAVADVTGRGVYRLVLEPAAPLKIELGRAPGADVPFTERFADVYAIRVVTRAGVLRTRIATSGSGLTVPAVLPGAYTIEVQVWCAIGPPCAGAIARGQIRAGGPAVVALRSQRYGVAEGVAIDPASGQPIAGAPITCDGGPCVWDVDGAWRELRTGPDGRYRIAGLAPGLHELRFGERPPVDVVVKPGP